MALILCNLSVCLPWNAATDSNSSLEQQGIIWKGWQNQHTVWRLSPCYSGSFGSAVCSEHQRPVRDDGLKGGDAQFNQTFGCLCVQGHEPPSPKKIHTLRKTMGRHHPLWNKETHTFFKTQVSVFRCLYLKSNQTLLGALERGTHPFIHLCIIENGNFTFVTGMHCDAKKIKILSIGRKIYAVQLY